MSLVAIDIGTTLIKCGRFIDNELEETWHYRTKDSAGIGGDLVKRVSKDEIALSSVAPQATADLEKAFGRSVFKVTPEGQNFIQDFHPSYGADSVCDAVAARELYAKNKNLAVFALGTCTALTTVSAQGIVGGGFITLGYHSMINGLKIAAQLTSTVEDVDYKKFDLDYGYTTNDQIMNGTALAQIGIVEQWLKLTQEKMGNVVSVATGGNANRLLDTKMGKIVDHLDPHLTINGVRLIYNASRNKG